MALQVDGRLDDLFELKLEGGQGLMDVLAKHGHTPLPPYIRRADETIDAERYQTVYASKPGAVAAPTAGLHFTRALIGDLEEKGAACAYVTLHVGAGTFQPIRAGIIENHRMHSEWYQVEEQVCEQVRAVKSRRQPGHSSGHHVSQVPGVGHRRRQAAAFSGGDGYVYISGI